jgi:hypothetical protein
MIQNIFLKINNIKFFFFALYFFSCNAQPEKKENLITYNNKLLKVFILGFTNSVSNNLHDTTVTVGITNKGDTVTISIANAYPDLSIAKFRAFDTINNFRVFFVGDPNNTFYQINSQMQIPNDIVRENKNLITLDSLPISYDPKQWLLYFKKDSLIGFYPEEEINKFVFKK